MHLRPASIGFLLVVCCGALLGWPPEGAAARDGAGVSANAPDQRLRDVEDEIRRRSAQREDIHRKAASIGDELAQIQTEMVRVARATQETEGNLSSLEQRMTELTLSEREKSEALDRRSRQMTGVLVALQRLAIHSTEALLAQQQRPADAVRSAIVLRTAVPQIESSARDLRGDMDALARLRDDIAEQRRRIAVMNEQLGEENIRLKDLWRRKAALQSETLDERAAMDQHLRTLASEAHDLRDLLARLEAERQHRLAEDAKAKAEAEAAAEAARLAMRKAAKGSDSSVAHSPGESEQPDAGTASLSPDGTENTEAKQEKLAQGRLAPPARGAVIHAFGEANAMGVTAKGITYQTREGAQVVAPFDGIVVFAGQFRGYGLLLIIEHGEGYHSLLAGLERVDAVVGQRVIVGEPVGLVGHVEEDVPSLYVELRHNGQPINPLPWISAQRGKVNG